MAAPMYCSTSARSKTYQEQRHNSRNNLAIQFSVLSFSLLEHSARGVASHLEVFAICVTARFYLSLLILCSITAFWRSTLGKRAWVTPVMGEEWSVNIKVWVNVLGGHSTVHPPHVVIGLLSMLLAAAAVMRGIPRTDATTVLERSHAGRGEVQPEYRCVLEIH
ncbi:hypothetical protein B0H13DRAFT_2099067 [Mycena leptocephala]|nr:hypothetical protein B0H13DRAFT_2099067 [Mycena leptocephala]